MLSSLKFRTPQVEQILGYGVGCKSFMYDIHQSQFKKYNIEYQPAQNLKSETFQAIKGEDTRYNSSSLAILLRKVDEGE